MAASSSHKKFHEPPIQRRHVGYGTAVHWVRAGITRFHRIERIEGIEHSGESLAPTIFIANHQNGLMDPLVLCSLKSPQQIHWLTRADIFNHPIARSFLFSFNQMPIYRKRDRLTDARERNKRIFEICAERLNIGASIGLFPEGNHRAVKSLRPLRRGVVDMVNESIQLNPELKSLKLIPVGIDYEEMASFRRRLTYRFGPSIQFDDLIDADSGQIAPGDLLNRIHDALNELMVNIQPESHYAQLLPFVRAMRTTEQTNWNQTREKIQSLGQLPESALEEIEKAFESLTKSGLMAQVRAEDLGLGPEQIRSVPWWFWLVAPIAVVGGICSWPLSKMLESRAKKAIKDPCFISTFKVSAGMALFPLCWLILAFPISWMVTGAWMGWGVIPAYLFNAVGSRIAGWWYGTFLDWNGARKAKKAYSNRAQSQAWSQYLDAIEKNLSQNP